MMTRKQKLEHIVTAYRQMAVCADLQYLSLYAVHADYVRIELRPTGRDYLEASELATDPEIRRELRFAARECGVFA